MPVRRFKIALMVLCILLGSYQVHSMWIDYQIYCYALEKDLHRKDSVKARIPTDGKTRFCYAGEAEWSPR